MYTKYSSHSTTGPRGTERPSRYALQRGPFNHREHQEEGTEWEAARADGYSISRHTGCECSGYLWTEGYHPSHGEHWLYLAWGLQNWINLIGDIQFRANREIFRGHVQHLLNKVAYTQAQISKPTAASPLAIATPAPVLHHHKRYHFPNDQTSRTGSRAAAAATTTTTTATASYSHNSVLNMDLNLDSLLSRWVLWRLVLSRPKQ